MADTTTSPATYNLFVNLLEGKTLNLKFTTPNVSAASIKHRLHEITKIPLRHQRLLTGTRHLADSDSLTPDAAAQLPTVHLLLRLVGGKGGFGSLLRGAATKAGQKKTSNFDACRDMSGRRLRHVNAENKLQEWRALEEQRKMEKKGEEFLKSLAKKGKKGSGDVAAEKYVKKYKEESARCVSEVVDAVKEAMSGKRKGKGLEPKSKRVKLWDSDTEEDDSDNEDEKEKSTVSNNGNSSDSNKEAGGGSLDSVTGGKQEGESSGRGSSESGSEEEKEMVVHIDQESIPIEKNDMVEDEKIATSASIPCSAADTVLGVEAMQDENIDCSGIEMQPQEISKSSDGQGVESTSIVSEANGSLESSPVVQEETVANGNTAEMEKPLNFDDFNSAAEMEVLGAERLKLELQAYGLKCGGTLRERAARLFMLKSTPIEKIPKKLLAKK
ncbi:PREDICTED: protein SDE2 homolog [Fragaria vesca subsp. vesca]|uniref:protein SDE2 homolog n=1 Tax=Fragaria vesca subsp. vesca TaxID=101020 RepID=UPI0002C2ED90|nr:PREDICTED: protein SDE2 homolog [Fragaria vesca subsp. vesca]